MKRTIHIIVVLVFLGSTSLFTLPTCLLTCPLGISGFEAKIKLIKESKYSQKPCCAKKNEAPQKPKNPVSCSLLLSKSQPQAAETLLRTVPDLQPATYAYCFSHTSVSHSESFRSGEIPNQARSTPIILEKQSLLI